MSDAVHNHLASTLEAYNATKEGVANQKSWIDELSPLKDSEDSEELFVEQTIKHLSCTEEDCTRTLAKLSALSVEQLLRIAVWCLGITEQKSTTNMPNFSTSCSQICMLCDYFDQELTMVSTVYIDVVQRISKYGQDNLKGKESKETNSQNRSNKIINSCKTTCNTIYIDVGNAISNIQEAKKFILTVAKFVIISSQKTQEATTAESLEKQDPETLKIPNNT